MYVVHLALSISDCLISPKMSSEANYRTALPYLCSDLLNDKSLYYHMQASLINDNSNVTKHSLKTTTPVNINETIDFYNKMITSLVQKLEMQELSFFLFKKPEMTDDPFRTKPFEQKCRVYDHDITITLHQSYRLDEFTHKAYQKVTIKWEKRSEDKITYYFYAQDKKRVLGHGTVKMDSINETNDYIEIAEGDSTVTPLGRKVQVYAKIQISHLFHIKKERKVRYTTGALFWKESHTRTEEYTDDEMKTAEVSPLYQLTSYLKFRES